MVYYAMKDGYQILLLLLVLIIVNSSNNHIRYHACNWTFNSILRFVQFQNNRVLKKEITSATVRNYVKSIKLLCEMADLPIAWKKITWGFSKGRRYADDRIPSIEEIKKLIGYPDRRIKAIVYTMASSGIRLGAWDYLHWGDIPHPAVFPEKLPLRCIKLHGVKPDMIVYDPFMGIGTTALACISLGVNYLGTEIDSEYVKVALEDIEKRRRKE